MQVRSADSVPFQRDSIRRLRTGIEVCHNIIP